MAKPITYTKLCLYCGDAFVSHRSHAKFCCNGCRASHANRRKPKINRKTKEQPSDASFFDRLDNPRFVWDEHGVKTVQFWSEAQQQHWLALKRADPLSGVEFWKLLQVDEDGTHYYSTGGVNACKTMKEYWQRRKIAADECYNGCHPKVFLSGNK